MIFPEFVLSNAQHPARLDVERLLAVCSVKRTRASGPGGQHRNKVETAVVITHGPTGIVGQASENRSQNKNREVAIRRLRINLALALRTEIKSESCASDVWLSRIKSKKISVNTGHSIYPALLSEALDVVEFRTFDVSRAAEDLRISTSQMVKFLKTTPAAFEGINRQRESIGLKRLR